MAAVNKQDSNVTGLRIAAETTIGVLPAAGTQIWNPLEPNSYADFGGTPGLTPRAPINPSRQKEKGVVTDFDADGGFNTDLTQNNLQDVLQGFFFAGLRLKTELAVATVNTGGVTDDFEPTAGGADFTASDLLFAKGFDDTANNGLHVVSGTPTGTEVISTSTLTVATGQTGTIVRVGAQAGSGDLDVVITGDFATVTSGGFDLRTLDLVPGEWIFLGDDTASTFFANAENNGPKRVRSVATDGLSMIIDKSDLAMVAETGTGLTIRIITGRALKNENGTEATFPILRTTYQLERLLGAPDDSNPTELQAQYLIGAVPNTFTLNVAQGDKLNSDLGFIALDAVNALANATSTIKSEIAAAAGSVAVNSPPIVSAGGLNTADDFKRVKMSVVSTTEEAPTSLFAYIEEATLEIDNGITPNKAIGVRGGFDASSADFSVGGSITAYFGDLASVDAVNNNSDVSFDFFVVRSNAGMLFDIPLCALGDGRPTVEKDEAVKLPLSIEAARATSVSSDYDHTLFAVFFDYLPNLAG